MSTLALSAASSLRLMRTYGGERVLSLFCNISIIDYLSMWSSSVALIPSFFIASSVLGELIISPNEHFVLPRTEGLAFKSILRMLTAVDAVVS